jgi:phytol kinase
MSIAETLTNVLLMLLSYVYILSMIFVSSHMHKLMHVSKKSCRKFLHAMIGNLPLIIPFFTNSLYPVLVAAPFILVTFLASPYSPFKNLNKSLKGLADITEEGHGFGLILYAISYTFLALFFASKPYIIAAGILPMAYGDGVASVIGERYGKNKYRLLADKSLEGSIAMCLVSLLSLTIGLTFFSVLYSFSIFEKIAPVIAVSVVATFVEGFSPSGSDNLTVPAFSAVTFLLLGGGA